MRKRWSIGLWVVMFGVLCAAAQKGAPGDEFVGTWTGTWDGAGTGGNFELTLGKDAKGALAGKVSVSGEPTYEATLKSVSFDGNKMTAKYAFTPDPTAEVALTATFTASAATGTWAVQAGGADVAAGGWNVKKK